MEPNLQRAIRSFINLFYKTIKNSFIFLISWRKTKTIWWRKLFESHEPGKSMIKFQRVLVKTNLLVYSLFAKEIGSIWTLLRLNRPMKDSIRTLTLNPHRKFEIEREGYLQRSEDRWNEWSENFWTDMHLRMRCIKKISSDENS